MTLQQAIIEYVAKNPGSTSKEIGDDAGQTARQACATMARKGLLRREETGATEAGQPRWAYFPATPSESVDKP